MSASTHTESRSEADRKHVFHPFSVLQRHEQNGPRRMMVRGSGSTVYDEDGRGYIDAMAGLWCVNIGYGRREIAEALHEQTLRLPYYHSFSSMATDTPALRATSRSPRSSDSKFITETLHFMEIQRSQEMRSFHAARSFQVLAGVVRERRNG